MWLQCEICECHVMGVMTSHSPSAFMGYDVPLFDVRSFIDVWFWASTLFMSFTLIEYNGHGIDLLDHSTALRKSFLSIPASPRRVVVGLISWRYSFAGVGLSFPASMSYRCVVYVGVTFNGIVSLTFSLTWRLHCGHYVLIIPSSWCCLHLASLICALRYYGLPYLRVPPLKA